MTSPLKYQDMIHEIQNFIEKKKQPDTIIIGDVIDVNPLEKSITVKFKGSYEFNKGSLVLVDSQRASVVDSYESTVKIQLKKYTDRFENKEVEIDTSFINVILERLEKTIKKIEEGRLDEANKRILDFIMGEEEPLFKTKNFNFIAQTLNHSQAQAVSRAVEAEDFHLIVGPPGTGKTFVIQEIIYQLIKEEEKVLVTAWTNIAVDNILERLTELKEKDILRIGPKNEISSTNMKYSIYEKRKQHKDWLEVERLDIVIDEIFKEIDVVKNIRSLIQGKIDKIITRRNNYENALENLLDTIKKYKQVADKYREEDSISEDLINIKSKMDVLEKDADKYYEITKKILDFAEMEDSLPTNESYYQLESDLKEMHRQKIPKRITSIIKRESYEKYRKELETKEENHKEMVDSINEYWDVRDGLEEDLVEIYPDGEGHPDQDAIDQEIRLLKIQDEYLTLKKRNIKIAILTEGKKLIYESYKQYLSSLDKKSDVLKSEIEDLKTEIDVILKSKEKLSERMDNLIESFRKYKNDRKQLIAEIDSEIVSKSKVITATCLSSANYILDNVFFDSVVMDEASQVASYMALIPLLKCQKFVLVGDNKQLQPIEEEKLSRELNLSIFNRLIEKYPDSYTFLDTQYRMNKEIADISSDLFYDGQLKTFEDVADQILDCELDDYAHNLLNPDKPITFIDTSKLDYHEDGTGSGCENTKEAGIVAHIVTILLKNGIDPNKIGIITPYVKHKNNIKKQLKDNIVEVDTVYRFQGREKDIIIMSFCKSKIGSLQTYMKRFLQRPTQLNVAITRAKSKLVIVGNSKTLRQIGLLKKMIGKIDEKDIIKCSEADIKSEIY